MTYDRKTRQFTPTQLADEFAATAQSPDYLYDSLTQELRYHPSTRKCKKFETVVGRLLALLCVPLWHGLRVLTGNIRANQSLKYLIPPARLEWYAFREVGRTC